MPWCPKCKNEYVAGITKCADCGSELVEELSQEEEVTELTEEEMESVPHFYMQSGLCYEKMSFPDKTLMKLLANMLSKKENKSNAELGQEQAIKSSYNISDEKYAKPLIEYLLGE